MDHIKRIVLTGGPCAGKTTALVRIVEHFSIDSFKFCIDYQSRQDAKSVMHLLRSASRQPRNGNPGNLTSMHHT